MKWYVIVDKYIDGRECVGINDESYFGDGEIISTHATDDEADSAAREYAQASGLPLLADIEQGRFMAMTPDDAATFRN